MDSIRYATFILFLKCYHLLNRMAIYGIHFGVSIWEESTNVDHTYMLNCLYLWDWLRFEVSEISTHHIDILSVLPVLMSAGWLHLNLLWEFKHLHSNCQMKLYASTHTVLFNWILNSNLLSLWYDREDNTSSTFGNGILTSAVYSNKYTNSMIKCWSFSCADSNVFRICCADHWQPYFFLFLYPRGL